MKKLLLTIVLCFITFNSSHAQEWLTSFQLAKRLALSKNKMMLVLWEDTASYSYPVIVEDKNGIQQIVRLFENDSIKQLIWQHFVPVLIQESEYDKLSKELLQNKSMRYVDRFNDDYLKVMDPNGNILNISPPDYYSDPNLSMIIRNYSLDISFLNPEVGDYFENKNFSTSFRLGAKYLDAAIYSDKFLKKEIVNLSDIYLSEAKGQIESSDLNNKEAFKQKLDLLEVKKALILSKPKRARRLLKKYKKEDIDDINTSLFAFLKFTTFRYLQDIEEALLWQDQVLQTDMNKVKFIVK